MRSHWVAIVLGLALIAPTAAAPAASESRAAAGTLEFQAMLVLISATVPCPAGVPPSTSECRARTVGSGLVVEGREIYAPVGELGWVNGTYTSPLGVGPPACAEGLAKPLATTGRLGAFDAQARFGEITFSLAEGTRCVGVESAWNEPQVFTITGGTGQFAGASGSGTVERSVGVGPYCCYPQEIWTTGTLDLDLDVTPPKLSGATAKTVRVKKGAKSARVTFEVTATDDMDGVVSVLCRPTSGSRFKFGRTRVRCVATDSSGNTATAEFTVTVKRGS